MAAPQYTATLFMMASTVHSYETKVRVIFTQFSCHAIMSSKNITLSFIMTRLTQEGSYTAKNVDEQAHRLEPKAEDMIAQQLGSNLL